MRRRFAAIAIGVLFFCAKSYCLTQSDAETEVRRLVRDTAASASLQTYSDSVIDSFLNQAQREVVTATWCLQKSTSITLSAGTTFYSLPSDFLAVKLVRFRDSVPRTRNLTETSYKALQESNPDYEKQAGPPMQYLVRYSTRSASTQEIAFLPVPTTSSVGTATVDYYKQATDLASDSDTILDGVSYLVPYHYAVVYMVAAKIKAIEGDTNGATFFLQLGQNMLQSMNSRMGERPNLNSGFSAGGPGFTGANSR